MGTKYDEGKIASKWPRLTCSENGGSDDGHQVRELHPSVQSELSEATPIVSFIELFFGRKMQNSACSRRLELMEKKNLRQKHRADWSEAERAAFDAEWYEIQLEWIDTIHQMCAEPVVWEHITASPPPFLRGERGPHEQLAEAEYTNYKPTRMQKLLKQDVAIKQELEEKIHTAKERDEKEYTEWKSLTDFACSILEGNRTAYLRVLEEIAPLKDLQALGSGLEFTILDASAVEVELDVNSGSIIPQESKLMSEDGMLLRRPLSREAQNALEYKYVCGSVLRIARELFALLPLETAVVHARDTKINLYTGQEEYVTVLSVLFERSRLSEISKDEVEEAYPPFLSLFDHHIKYDAALGFGPVEKLCWR